MPTEAVNLKIYHHTTHYTFYDHFLFFLFFFLIDTIFISLNDQTRIFVLTVYILPIDPPAQPSLAIAIQVYTRDCLENIIYNSTGYNTCTVVCSAFGSRQTEDNSFLIHTNRKTYDGFNTIQLMYGCLTRV